MASIQRAGNAEAIAKIEEIFKGIADNLFREESISIPLRCKKPELKSADTLDGDSPSTLAHVSFPARTPQEARRFTVLVRILELVHQALCVNEVISKRNIYYKDPELFKSQHIVDRYVDILAYTFGVQRASLNVIAAAKGLIIGEYALKYSDGTVFKQKTETPRLIADISDIQEIDVSAASWILVIEKESTFRTLASSNLHQTSLAGKGIILTAKGYPDISTRAFLHLMSAFHDPGLPPHPIYVLADFDPDGMAVMSTYKHGSWNLSHESSQLLVPCIQWLGIRSADIIMSVENRDEEKGLLKLSGRDRHKATKMLENSAVFREDGEEIEWRRELQVMLMLNVKAEMEALAEREGGVAGWVEGQLLEQSKALLRTEEDFDEMLI